MTDLEQLARKAAEKHEKPGSNSAKYLQETILATLEEFNSAETESLRNQVSVLVGQVVEARLEASKARGRINQLEKEIDRLESAMIDGE